MEWAGRGSEGTCAGCEYHGASAREEAKRQVSIVLCDHRCSPHCAAPGPAPHLPSNSLALLTGHVLRSLAYCKGEAEQGGPEQRYEARDRVRVKGRERDMKERLAPQPAWWRRTSSGGTLASGRIMGKDGRAWTSVAVSGLVLMARLAQGQGAGADEQPARRRRQERRPAATVAAISQTGVLASISDLLAMTLSSPRQSQARRAATSKAGRGRAASIPPNCGPSAHLKAHSLLSGPRGAHLIAPSAAGRLGFGPVRRRQAVRAAESRLMAAGSLAGRKTVSRCYWRGRCL